MTRLVKVSDGWNVVLLAAAVLLLLAIAVIRPEPMPPPMHPPSLDFVAFQPGPGPAPVVVFSADEQRLTVTAHARRDLLVCLRGECRLVEEWVGK